VAAAQSRTFLALLSIYGSGETFQPTIETYIPISLFQYLTVLFDKEVLVLLQFLWLFALFHSQNTNSTAGNFPLWGQVYFFT